MMAAPGNHHRTMPILYAFSAIVRDGHLARGGIGRCGVAPGDLPSFDAEITAQPGSVVPSSRSRSIPQARTPNALRGRGFARGSTAVR